MNYFYYTVCKDHANLRHSCVLLMSFFVAYLSSLKMSLQCVIVDLLIIECFSHFPIYRPATIFLSKSLRFLKM